MNNFTRMAGATGIALIAMAGAALADGYGEGSSKDAPAAEGRKLSWSMTLGGTSDYVFRGLSLSDEKPAAQGSIDLSYGIFYAGVWGSNLDDGLTPGITDGVGPAEVDVYAGFKPVVGPVTFGPRHHRLSVPRRRLQWSRQCRVPGTEGRRQLRALHERIAGWHGLLQPQVPVYG